MENEVNETTENPGETEIEPLKRKEKITGTVTNLTLAGAIVDIGQDKPGFVHLARIQDAPLNRVEDVLEVGQEVQVWVLRADPNRNHIDLTMVEPLGLEWREIKKGMIVKGTVSRIENFGAFLEIGAERPGLVHISEMAHRYVRNPHEVVSIGDEVEAKVLAVNKRRKQIKLSMKSLIPEGNPLETIAEEFSAEEEEEDDGPIPTAMEMALREAMQKSSSEDSERPKRKSRSQDGDEIEDMFSRTLEGYKPSE